MRKTVLMVLLFTGYWANANQLAKQDTPLKSKQNPPQKNGKVEKLAVTVSNGGHISLWDINTGHTKTGILIPNGLSVNEFSYNAEKNYVVAVCSNALNSAQLFVWKTYEDKGEFIKLSKTKTVRDIRLCDDNANILVSYTDNSIEYVDLLTKQVTMLINLKSLPTNLDEVLINKSQNLIVVPSEGSVSVYDLETKAKVKELDLQPEKIAFSPNGEKLLIKTQEKVKVYDTKSYSLLMEKDASLLDLADKNRTLYNKE